MFKILAKKWWVLLLQGVLLIILGIFIMRYPGKMLLGLSVWLGIITLMAGAVGLFGYFGTQKGERETSALVWSLLTIVLAFIMLGNLVVTMKLLVIFFGSWVSVTGIFLVRQGWELKNQSGFGWFVLILGAVAAVAGLMMAFNLHKGVIGISLFLGFQAILLGFDFILIGLLKRGVVKKLTQ